MTQLSCKQAPSNNQHGEALRVVPTAALKRRSSSSHCLHTRPFNIHCGSTPTHLLSFSTDAFELHEETSSSHSVQNNFHPLLGKGPQKPANDKTTRWAGAEKQLPIKNSAKLSSFLNSVSCCNPLQVTQRMQCMVALPLVHKRLAARAIA